MWACRGLLWAWDGAAVAAVTGVLGDEAWRVREAALKVVAKHRILNALAAVERLEDDPVPRVRAAAARTLGRLGRTG